MDKHKEKSYVFPYDPVEIPEWIWGLVLGGLFLLFVLGIYYAVRIKAIT